MIDEENIQIYFHFFFCEDQIDDLFLCLRIFHFSLLTSCSISLLGLGTAGWEEHTPILWFTSQTPGRQELHPCLSYEWQPSTLYRNPLPRRMHCGQKLKLEVKLGLNPGHPGHTQASQVRSDLLCQKPTSSGFFMWYYSLHVRKSIFCFK